MKDESGESVDMLMERLSPDDRRRSDFDEMSVGRRIFEVTRDEHGGIAEVRRAAPSDERLAAMEAQRARAQRPEDQERAISKAKAKRERRAAKRRGRG